MAAEIKIPKATPGNNYPVENGKILEWRKKEGEEVRRRDVIVILELTKVAFEI